MRSAKLATPLTADTGVVPVNVPLAGLASIAIPIEAVDDVTVLPCASWTRTCTGGAIGCPATVLLGCTAIANAVGVPGVTAKAVLVTPVSGELAATSVYPVPVLSTVRSEKVATPATAFTVAVPPSVPPPGLVPIASVIDAVEPVTVFPFPSWTATVTAAIVAPATTSVGCAMKPSWAAAPGVTSKPVLVSPVSPVLDAVSV